MKLVLLTCLLYLTLSSCFYSDYEEGPLASPSRKYSLIAKVNQTNKQLTTYAKVELFLFDQYQKELDRLDTRAGDVQKWAVGWMDTSDQVVLYSSDIGVLAWRLSKANKLEKIDGNAIDKEILKKAKQLYKQKYHKEDTLIKIE